MQPKSPKFTFSINGSYDAPLSDDVVGFLRANYNYRSSVYFHLTNDPTPFRRGCGIFGGQIGVRSADGRWSAAVFGRDLFNTRFFSARPLSDRVAHLIRDPHDRRGAGFQIRAALTARAEGA